MTIRRVVTGHDDNGKAIVLIDGPATNVKVRAAAGGLVSTIAWVSDQTPADVSATTDLGAREIGVAPPEGGSVFRVVEFPPLGQGAAAIDHDAVMREMGLGSAHAAANAVPDAVKSRSPFIARAAWIMRLCSPVKSTCCSMTATCTSKPVTFWCNKAPTMPG